MGPRGSGGRRATVLVAQVGAEAPPAPLPRQTGAQQHRRAGGGAVPGGRAVRPGGDGQLPQAEGGVVGCKGE